MQSIRARRQLAGILLSLLALLAFNGSAWADCFLDAGAGPGDPAASEGHPMGHGGGHQGGADCHDAADPDCPHHAAASPCLSAADCEGPTELLPCADRKSGEADPSQVMPAWVPMPVPEPQREPGLALSPDTRSIPSEQRFLLCCRFLE